MIDVNIIVWVKDVRKGIKYKKGKIKPHTRKKLASSRPPSAREAPICHI
jgi:hypothetical protein